MVASTTPASLSRAATRSGMVTRTSSEISSRATRSSGPAGPMTGRDSTGPSESSADAVVSAAMSVRARASARTAASTSDAPVTSTTNPSA